MSDNFNRIIDAFSCVSCVCACVRGWPCAVSSAASSRCCDVLHKYMFSKVAYVHIRTHIHIYAHACMRAHTKLWVFLLYMYTYCSLLHFQGVKTTMLSITEFNCLTLLSVLAKCHSFSLSVILCVCVLMIHIYFTGPNNAQ